MVHQPAVTQFNPLLATQLVAPSMEDWVVRFKMRDGTTLARRVTPGTVTAETAISRALASLGARRHMVVDHDCMRYADTRKLVIPAGQGGT